MKEHPILFNSEMVRAILSGRKTQTRRPLRVQPRVRLGVPGWYPDGSHHRKKHYATENHMRCGLPFDFAPWQPVDRLWVREAFHATFDERGFPMTVYLADLKDRADFPYAMCPSIHMPKRYSRITLEVVSVRVQRVQEISEEAAIKEGISRCTTQGQTFGWDNYLWHGNFCNGSGNKLSQSWKHQYSNYATAYDSFSSLWELRYAKRGLGWDANPWVWATEFRRVES